MPSTQTSKLKKQKEKEICDKFMVQYVLDIRTHMLTHFFVFKHLHIERKGTIIQKYNVRNIIQA